MFDLNKEKVELNLDNPIFVCYINTINKTRQGIEKIIEETKKSLDVYTNITFWIIASDRDEIVCVYDGWGRNRDSELIDLIEEINKKIEIMSESHNFDDFKIRIRDWRLAKLIGEKK
jgi:hypothetical protein